MLIEDICDGLDLLPGDGLLETRGDGHHEERQSADPNDRGQQMKPVIHNRNKRIEIGDDALEGVHRNLYS
jgi:hypothetical protein